MSAQPPFAGAGAGAGAVPAPATLSPAAAAAARSTWLDAAKGGACLLIVLHHLAFYGPMSDAALPLAPGLIGWLYDQGRLAVQLFLVVGGWLAAASLAPRGSLRPGPMLGRLGQRYRRLAVPLTGALVAAVLAAQAARWLGLAGHPAVPDEPTLAQLLAHAVLLHDLLDHPALSAGVWYVAIDLQLYAVALLLLRAGSWRGRFGIVLVLLLAVGSLLEFNRREGLDDTGLYFFGAYGLGMLAYWASRSRHAVGWAAVLAAVVVAALALDFRSRIAVAGAVAAVIVLLARSGCSVRLPRLEALGRVSYSVFVVHFPVCLLVGALVHAAWPGQPVPNAVGLVLAVCASMAAGRWMHARLEVPPATWRRLLAVQALLLAASACVAVLPG